MNVEDWDKRFAADELPYGLEPNTFLVEEAARLSNANILCIAEGYGRNATWLAAQGHRVTAVEQSSVGIARAKALAAERGVSVEILQGDLETFDLGESRWDAIVSIFVHLPPELRADVYARAVRALAPGGLMIVEAYCPAQLGFRSGGPREVALLPTREQLVRELDGLEFLVAREIEREVNEGALHHGAAAVVQVVGRK
jgi:SAM-dependent methyltransferase